ncbi:MAG: CRTAC1 family protein [Acidobacteriota bacterium]
MENNQAPGPLRRHRRWVIAAVIFAFLFAGYHLTAYWVDQDGQTFFEAGRDGVLALEDFSDALVAGDESTALAVLADDFSGQPLGLNNLRQVEDDDGIRILQFTGGEQKLSRDEAIAEWRDYVSRFSEIEDMGLHIHRLDSWSSSGAEASVRFETIGQVRGEARPIIDRGYFQMTFRYDGQGGAKIVEASLIEGERTAATDAHFVDVGNEAGVDFENQYYPRFLTDKLKFAMLKYGPAGITAVDIDDDGLHDLFIPDGVDSRFFRNSGDGTFEDITERSGLAGLSGVSVGIFGDIDNDGDKDFFVSRTFEPNQIFRNDGLGPDGIPRFVDNTAAAGIDEDCCTTVASFADIDNDGYLDLYVGRYLEPHTEIPETFYARNGEPNSLYHNQGDGTFVNITESAGVGEVGLCLGTVFGDYDDDGDLDLYVVNDFGRNTLYRNEGDLTFTDVTVATNTLAYGAGMNASFGDYDDDGKLDIYVTNIRSEFAWFGEPPVVRRYMLNSWRQGVWKEDIGLYMEIMREADMPFHKVFQQMGSGNTLLRNNGDGTFEDVTWDTNANPPGWFWGASFADFDNDTDQDLYAANGWVYNDKDTELELNFFNGVVGDQEKYKSGHFYDPQHFGSTSWHGWERNRHLRNNGDGTFREVGLATGSGILTNSRGVAVADYWNRGVLDIAVAASTERHSLLKNVVGIGRNYLQVELRGGAPELADGMNPDAVGARIYLRSGGKLQFREIVLGDGYGSQNTLRMHFGLGAQTTADELKIVWPRSGREQIFTNVAGNRIVEVTEGRDALVEKIYPTWTGIAADAGEVAVAIEEGGAR